MNGPGIHRIVIPLFAFSLLFYSFNTDKKGDENRVRVINNDNIWRLEVNGREFHIKGVVGNSYLEKVKEYGGNSIRTGWQKDQLDKVHNLSLMALVNLPAGAERDGMNYDDTTEVRKQTSRIISIVEKTKDHPAVLMWAIGNELDYIPPLESFNPKVWDAVNQAAKAIHEIDPDHPVMTVIGTSMMHKVTDIVRRCPDIDLLGINTYGDIYTLQDTLKKYGWYKPYVITEWGPDGYWEVPKAAWGAPFEQTGLEKLNCYRTKYLSISDPKNKQCLGSYVFYWSGFKQETTHTWFCMFNEEGLESPLPGLMKYLWTGRKKRNEAPLVDSINTDGMTCFKAVVLNPDDVLPARVFAHDTDNDKIVYKWEIRPEAKYAAYAGQGELVPEPVPDLITGSGAMITFKAPSSSGAYRLFVYAYDGHGHFSTANLPFFVLPVVPESPAAVRYTSRTLSLLNNSTPQVRNSVKILVYGQSISEQEWWLEVKRSITDHFPNSDIIMVNKSIGGFAAQLLYKTVEMDVSSFYPDMVLLHIYGDNRYYDTVLYTIRSRTAAEIAIMNDHYTGQSQWSDTMSYWLLPAMAEKYKCDIINIRDPWKKLLEEQQIEPSRLLRDGVHLNDFGNFLMAELVKAFFSRKPDIPSDPFGLLTVYKSGRDFNFRGDTLTLTFHGNKVEVKAEKIPEMNYDPLKVLLDDKPPSTFQGTYYISRPYNENGKAWPWSLPAMISIRHTKPWIDEEWTCTFTNTRIPYSDFNFTVKGSVTGPDGDGSACEDFISNSGRVIIRGGDAEEGGDWHLNRSYKVLKTIVNDGDAVKWKTYSISMDIFDPQIMRDKKHETCMTLFQGIPAGVHTLKLVKTGMNAPVITDIRVFNPYLHK